MPDITCVYGQYHYDLLTEKSIYEPEQVIVTGQPRYDILHNIDKIYSKKRFQENYEVKLNEKIIEKVVDDENIALNHMILTKDTGLPEHYSNSNVYMIIISGTMTLKLGEQEAKKYQSGDIINIPYNIKMNVNNFDDEVLEIFVIKAPNPRHFKGE